MSSFKDELVTYQWDILDSSLKNELVISEVLSSENISLDIKQWNVLREDLVSVRGVGKFRKGVVKELVGCRRGERARHRTRLMKGRSEWERQSAAPAAESLSCKRRVAELQFFASVLLLNVDNYTFREYANMMLLFGEARCNGRAAHQLYEEHFPHSQTPLHTLFAKDYQWASEMGTFTTNRSGCCVLWQWRTPKFDEAVLNAAKVAATSTQNSAIDSMCIIKLSGVFCLSSCYTSTTVREYMQCVQRISLHSLTTAGGSCTIVLMSLTFHGASSSLMKPGSPGKVFSIPSTAMFGPMKTRVIRTIIVFSNDMLMRVIEVNMKQCQNERVEKMGDSPVNPLTNGIIRHDSHATVRWRTLSPLLHPTNPFSTPFLNLPTPLTDTNSSLNAFHSLTDLTSMDCLPCSVLLHTL
ncbi:hypothetical protein PR048_011990 [Dryococelus australis]|uniref:DUF4817 domain-containing protein n=1 Tax=Dryococelus australis TaxID=614101 RepID=A0ABQ9HNN2_9NEOP|nr:hypothetical protein PR048_011990 [Dryococelus australis]